MCGIGGHIGHSHDPKISHELTTRLFSNLETRGLDAAGFWAVEVGKTGRVFYHKEPIRSSEFVDTPFWARMGNFNTNILIAHARGATRGMGDPSFNYNNHPFVSQDRRLALVHNGVIHESSYLRQIYETLSDCDSEILLRIYESMDDMPLLGISKIWSLVREGHMAVAIGERHINNVRSLALFRNDRRPLWIADLRQDLGQIFFFSSVEIWERAVARCRSHILRKGHKLVELRPAEAWIFRLDEKLDYARYEIEIKKNVNEEPAENFHKVKPAKVRLEIITELEEGDSLSDYRQGYQEFDFENTFNSTRDWFDGVMTETYNLWQEGSLGDIQIEDIQYHCKQIVNHLAEISQIKGRQTRLEDGLRF